MWIRSNQIGPHFYTLLEKNKIYPYLVLETNNKVCKLTPMWQLTNQQHTALQQLRPLLLCHRIDDVLAGVACTPLEVVLLNKQL